MKRHLHCSQGLKITTLIFASILFGFSQVKALNFPEVAELPSKPELPDPLVMFNGERVTSARQWTQQRRPELKLLFQHYMYGYLAPAPKNLKSRVEFEHKDAFNGKATVREVKITYGPEGTPPLYVLVAVPNQRQGRVPAFLGMNFCGNQAVVNDPAVHLPTVWIYNGPGVTNNRATEASRGTQINTWAIEQSIDRGYAVATFYSGDIGPDKPGFKEGVFPFIPSGQEPSAVGKKVASKPSAGVNQERGPHDWANIAAWAWGFSRAMDYLQTCREIDGKRIAAVGHSRNGKTALLAAAMDERFGLVIPLQAGCGGTAPSRGKVGETVKQINTSFPHWFDDTFKLFNDQVDRLPFDQHCLIALVAPRPVLLANAMEDTWANPVGQFEMLQAAEPVYRLLKAGGLDATQMPEVGKLVESVLGYYIRPGKHSMTTGDWKIFLDFADKHFKAKR